jgi:hypothetical protein
MDFVEVLAEGTMKAAAMIIANKGLGVPTGEPMTKLIAAMREEITTNYDDVLIESRGALSIGAEQARQVINVNCNLFAVRALRTAGVLPEVVNETAISTSSKR